MKKLFKYLKANIVEFWILYIVAFCGGFAVGACHMQRYYITHQNKASHEVMKQYDKIIEYDKLMKNKEK